LLAISFSVDISRGPGALTEATFHCYLELILSPELQQIRAEVERVTLGQSEAAWDDAPAGKWSSGQILEHLRLGFTGTTRGLMNVMDSGRPLGSVPTLSDRLKAFVVTRLGFMPSGRSAPPHALPKEGLEANVLRRLYDALVALDATLTDVERRFGSNVKLLDHPVLGPLNANQWRRLHRVHALHHLKQIAERRREASGRPVDRQLSH
jgi:hypothetical protein